MTLQKKDIHTIAIYRALHLGDLLCSLPALAALRRAFPSAHISFIGLPWAKSFVKRFPLLFDEFIAAPPIPGLPEQKGNEKETRKFLSKMRKRNIDLLLQMHGNGKIVNPILHFIKPHIFAGFYEKGKTKKPSEYFFHYAEETHEIFKHLGLMKHLGIPVFSPTLFFPFTQTDFKEYEDLQIQLEPQAYICIHAGARSIERQWKPEYFSALGDIARSLGYQVILTGSVQELSITREVESHMEHTAINLTGKTSLGSLAVLIKHAKVVITNDTGPSHLAAALKIPSIVLSLPENISQWSPLNSTRHKVIDNSLPNAQETALFYLNNYLSHQSFSSNLVRGKTREFLARSVKGGMQ